MQPVTQARHQHTDLEFGAFVLLPTAAKATQPAGK